MEHCLGDTDFARIFQGRWLLVSADDESWKRIGQDFDCILEFAATTRFRIAMKPKTAKGAALLAASDVICEEDYRIEDGLIAQSFGCFDLLSRLVSNPGGDELVFERVRVRIRGWCFDESELNDCKVLLRRIRE